MARVKTLLIGVGGTGTNIVRRLLETWEKRYGVDHPVPQDIAVALIDAQADGPQGSAALPESVYWTRTKHMDFPQQFAQYEQHLGWFPKNVKPEPGVRFNDGCGAIRSFGKFFAFLFAQTLEETLRSAIGTITDHGMRQAGEEFQWQVWIVGSLGNGTGGGTFMDVAAMARSILVSEDFITPLVYGLFIPSSVTRLGHKGDELMESQVAASGLAALIELQYEFDRRGTRGWQPSGEYVMLGVRNNESQDTGVIRYHAGAGSRKSGADDVSPFDFAFLLDRKGRNKLNKEYPDLLVTGAGVLDMVLEGADQDSRMLDLMARCADGRRFGSVGAVRLEAPSLLLRDYAANAQALHAVKAGAGAEAHGWESVLADRVPGGTALPATDADSIEESVAFFFGEVLKARETGKGGPGSVNEFFDRFEESRTELEERLRYIRTGLARARKPHEITKLGADLQDLLGNESGTLRAAWRKEWLEGPKSHWAAVPAASSYDELDAMGPTVGLKWLIDQRAARFVAAGAFGLLEAWLLELEEEIEVHKASIWAYEHQEYVGGRTVDTTEDLSTRIDGLRKKATSILSFLMAGEIRREAQQVGQGAEALLDFLLWETKVEIIDELYERMRTHAAVLREGASRAAARMGSSGNRSSFHRAMQQAEKALDLNMKQARTATGVGISFFVGGDAEMRRKLVDDLEHDAATSARAILGAGTETHRQVFHACLGSNVQAYGGPAPLTQLEGRDAVMLETEIRGAVGRASNKEVDARIGQVCHVEELLLGEARAVVDRWYKESFIGGQGADRAVGADARRLLRDRVGHELVKRITALDWANDPGGAMKRSELLYLAGRLNKLVSLAAPQWSIGKCMTHEKRFFTFNRDLGRINEAAGWLKDQLGVDVMAQAIDRFPRTAIECVTLEVGARLPDLRVEPELEEYRRTLDDKDVVSKGFSPHTTRGYEQAGLAYLDQLRSEAVAAGTARSDGALVLALALYQHDSRPDLFGWLESSRAGNYKLAKDVLNVPTPTDPDGPYRGSWKAGTPKLFPKGIKNVVEALEGELVDLADALKDKLWSDLLSLNWPGDEAPQGVERRPWQAIAEDLGAYAAELSAGAAGQEGDHNEVAQQMATDLQRLVVELVEGQGRAVPTGLLRD